MAKETIINIQTELTVWENIFATNTSEKGLISKMYMKNTYHSRPGTQTIQLKNGQRT